MIKEIFRGTIKLYSIPFIVIVGLFFMSVVLGAMLPGDMKVYILELVGEKFEDILSGVQSNADLTLRIFFNNLVVAIIVFILGFTVALPLLIITSNGIMVGVFLSLFYRMDAVSPGIFSTSLVSLIPHGIFELGAIFFAYTLSVMVVVKAIFHTSIEPKKRRRRVFAEAGIRFGIIIIPLLLIAAVIEVYASNPIGDVIGEWFYQDNYTEDLVITIDPTFLANHECLLESGYVSSYTNVGLSDSISTAAQILYSPELYDSLHTRKQLPYWNEYYYCADDLGINIQSWPANDWSTQDASWLQGNILSTMNIEYNPLELLYINDEGPFVWSYQIHDVQRNIGFATIDSTTVTLQWTGESTLIEEMLPQSIPSPEL